MKDWLLQRYTVTRRPEFLEILRVEDLKYQTDLQILEVYIHIYIYIFLYFNHMKYFSSI